MTMTFHIKAEGINGEEIEFWNGPQGKNWVKQNDLTDLMYDPFGERAIEGAALQPGERVLDVGCGCGKTTVKLAKAVAPGGCVTAVDPSIPMLEVAQHRLNSYAESVQFVCADAATYSFEPESYDVLFSQFGLMFFHNPEEAMTNLFRALRPGGRVAFVCWRLPELNPFLMIPFEAVRSFVPDMPVPSPDVLGSPFTLAREARVRGLLEGAGFEGVRLEEFNYPTRMGKGHLEECLKFVADFSNPVATALRRSEPTKRDEIMSAVRAAVAPFHNGETLDLPASAWIVTAGRP